MHRIKTLGVRARQPQHARRDDLEARLLEARGAQRVAAPFPIGVEGTTAWLRAAAAACGINPRKVDEITAPTADSVLARMRGFEPAGRQA